MNKETKFNFEDQRFEFLLYINGNIICQRFFDIYGYNPNILKSMDLRWLSQACVEIIKDDLEDKTRDYLYKYFNPYVKQELEDIQRINIYDKDDTFQFEIRVDKKTVVKELFSGAHFPPKVRYQVDIKSIIPRIIYEIRSVFSQKKYVAKYGEIELK